jgi:molybdopterin-guanine dinucleotide biosynthesis protein A
MSFQVERWCAIVLADESGSSISRDILSDRTIQHEGILDTPNALLRIGGIPLLDHWLQWFSKACIRNVIIVGNDQNYSKLLEWATTRGLPSSKIVKSESVNLGTNSFCGLNQILNDERMEILSQNLLFVSCDALFHSDFKLRNYLAELPSAGGVLYDEFLSTKQNEISCLTASDSIIRSELMKGKYETPNTGDKQICLNAYAYRRVVVPDVLEYFKRKDSLSESNDPQNLFNWMIKKKNMEATVHKSDGIFNMQTLLGYKAALSHYSAFLAKTISSLPPSVTHRCPARVGLMGNPSDGFKGKTLSFLISNFEATVTIRENLMDGSGEQCRAVTLVPHPVLDPGSFCDIAHLQLHTINKVSLA